MKPTTDFSYTRTLDLVLTKPLGSIETEADERKSRLLSAILLIIISLQLITLIPRIHTGIPEFLYLASVANATAYLLSRFGQHHMGAVLWGSTNSATVFFSVITEPDSAIAAPYFLSFSVLLVSLMFNKKTTVFVGIFNIAGLMTLQSYSDFSSSVYIFNTATLILAIALVHYSDKFFRLQEKEIERQALHIKSLIDSTDKPVYGIDKDNKLTFANPACLKTLGYNSLREILGKNSHEVLHCKPSESESICPLCEANQLKRSYKSDELVFKHQNGSTLEVEVMLTPISTKNTPAWSVVTFDNISERKKIEAELFAYKSKLEELVQQRTKELENAQNELIRSERLATLGKLTATISHEIRNPLAAMPPSLYLIEKLVDTSSDPRIKIALERIARNVARCDQIIDELLDFARTTDPDIKLHLLDNWISEFIKDHPLPSPILLHTQLGLGERAVGFDRNRLQRVLINLMDNARDSLNSSVEKGVNSTPSVTIKTELDGDKAVISVIDNGLGIPQDVQDRMFEPLFSTKTHGVGLGMPTIKQIIEQHQGQVSVSSKEGEGATLSFWLPLDTQKRVRAA
ncbi:MAG: ATP-binding protein [Gammaproteobacteria bacterium]|nr:ATP-binding protein [Gammaproteobacteria bacterium]